jgi:integration host factor subunit alpha
VPGLNNRAPRFQAPACTAALVVRSRPLRRFRFPIPSSPALRIASQEGWYRPTSEVLPDRSNRKMSDDYSLLDTAVLALVRDEPPIQSPLTLPGEVNIVDIQHDTFDRCVSFAGRAGMSGKTITRADLSEAVSQKVGLSRTESSRLIELVLKEITDCLARGETVKLSSFGSFVVRKKGQRIGHNPRTGKEVPISARRVTVFKSSPIFKQQINYR